MAIFIVCIMMNPEQPIMALIETLLPDGMTVPEMDRSVPLAPAEGGQAQTRAMDRELGTPEARLAQLLTAVAAHNEAALGQFYDATIARVYALALRITRRSDAAEEVAEDVYLQVWREARQYDASRGKVLAWLLTICRNRAIDSIRCRDRAEADPEPERHVAQFGGDDPQDLLQAVERERALHSALARLAPIERQLLALAFFRGLTHQEIAQHSRLPLGSVKTLIRRSLIELRRALANSIEIETT